MYALILFGWGAACRAPVDPPIRLGVERSLEEVGVAPFLAAAYGHATGRDVQLKYVDGLELAVMVEKGDLDEVLLVSRESLEPLRREGLLRQLEPLAHEELVLIGPFRDLLGKHAEAQGANLIKNVARTNHRFLEGRPGSVESTRLDRLFRETGDRAKPGSWFVTPDEGRSLVRAAVKARAFALVRRSSVLLESREGRFPERVWGQGDPALALVVEAGEVAPAKSGRPLGFHEWLVREGRAALAVWGSDRLGHPLYGPGAPREGEGASFAPLWKSSASEAR